MTEHNMAELENGRPKNGDEADTIRRWSRGDDFHGGHNAKASIEGGFWIALIAVIGVIATAIIAGYALGVGEARSEDISARIGVLGSRISVLEYDSARICAQLIEQQLIEACH